MFRSVVVVGLAIAVCGGIAGCRQDMQDQPRMFPLRGSTVFPDGRSARYQLTGTIARGQEDDGSYFATGKIGDKEGEGFPFSVDIRILERGQERFNIYCSPCHSRVGTGDGRIVERGYYQAADLQSERLREAPEGHFFNVITHGYGAMPDYHAELSPADRWAVVAYIRALQLSQSAKTTDAPPGAKIVSLTEVAEDEGLSTSFASRDWGIPSRPANPPTIAMSLPKAATPGPEVTAAFRSRASQAQTGSSSEAKEPAGEKPAPKPSESSAGDAAAGKQLYVANCQVCHQPNREGLQPVFPSLVGVVDKAGVNKVRDTITNGVPTAKVPMPSFAAKFSPADIDNLIAFLKTKP